MRLLARLEFLVAGLALLALGASIVLAVLVAEQQSAVPDYDYRPLVESLLAEQGAGEAKLIAVGEYLEANPDLPNSEWIGEQAERARRERASLTRKGKDLLSGFFRGRGDSAWGVGGALASDLLIIGDVRDLVVQGARAVRGDDVDEVMVVLAGVGIASSAATLVPEPGSTASGAPIEAGTSLLKSLRRGGAFSNPLAGQLLKRTRDVPAAEGFGILSGFASDTHRLAKSTPEGTLAVCFRQAESLDDVRILARVVEKAPTESVTALALDGPRGMEWLRSMRLASQAQISRKLRKGAQAFEGAARYSRIIKLVYRGRLEEVFSSLVDVLLHAAPRVRLMVGGLGAVLALLGAAVLRRAMAGPGSTSMEE